MVNVQVRNVPERVLDVLREEAKASGRSMQEHLLSVLEAHTARAVRNALFAELDEALGDIPVTDEIDSVEAVRADRDALDARDEKRARQR